MVNIFQADLPRFEFLKKELDGLKTAQAKSKEAVTEFIKGLLDRYFERFPRDLTIDPKGKSRIRIGRQAREGKIRRWLNNHTTKGRVNVMDGELVYVGPAEPDSSTEDELCLEGEGAETSSKGKGKETRVIVSKERVMSKADRNTLLRALVEGSITDEKNYTTPANLAFLSMFSVDLKDEIQANHKAYLADESQDPGNKKSLLTFQADESRRLLENSTPAVKALVEKYRRQGSSVLRKMVGETVDEYEKRLEEDKADKLNEAIKNIGDLVEDFLLAVKEVTGYVGIAYLGGEDPDNKGTILCKFINSGKTLTHGSTFSSYLRGLPLQTVDKEDLIKLYFKRWASLAILPSEASQDAVASSSKSSVVTKREDGPSTFTLSSARVGAKNRTPPVTVRNPPSIIGDPDIEFLGEVSPGTVVRDRKKAKASLARGLKTNPIVVDDDDDIALGKRDGKVADVVDAVLDEEERGRSLRSRRAARQIVPSLSPTAGDVAANPSARAEKSLDTTPANPASSSSATPKDVPADQTSTTSVPPNAAAPDNTVTSSSSSAAVNAALTDSASSSSATVNTASTDMVSSYLAPPTAALVDPVGLSSTPNDAEGFQLSPSISSSAADNAAAETNAVSSLSTTPNAAQDDPASSSLTTSSFELVSGHNDSTATKSDSVPAMIPSGKEAQNRISSECALTTSETAMIVDTTAERQRMMMAVNDTRQFEATKESIERQSGTVTYDEAAEDAITAPANKIALESKHAAKQTNADIPTVIAASHVVASMVESAEKNSETNDRVGTIDPVTAITAGDTKDMYEASTDTATSSMTLELEGDLSNVPPHLKKPATCLMEVFEDDFKTMVLKWLVSEKLLGFKENKNGRLVGNRPNEIGVWSRGFRTYNPKKFPAIMDVEEFDKTMYAWWDVAAPGGQEILSNVGVITPRQPDAAEKWDNLRVGGHNGLQTVLFGLAFWKTHNRSHGTKVSLERYSKLCEDVEWVLSEFIAKLKDDEKRKKRDLEEAEGPEQSNAKKVRA